MFYCTQCVQNRETEKYTITGDVLLTQTYGMILPKEDANFKKFIDKELAKEMIGGSVSKIYDKWFRKVTPVRLINLDMPMNRLLTEQFRFPNDQQFE